MADYDKDWADNKRHMVDGKKDDQYATKVNNDEDLKGLYENLEDQASQIESKIKELHKQLEHVNGAMELTLERWCKTHDCDCGLLQIPCECKNDT